MKQLKFHTPVSGVRLLKGGKILRISGNLLNKVIENYDPTTKYRFVIYYSKAKGTVLFQPFDKTKHAIQDTVQTWTTKATGWSQLLPARTLVSGLEIPLADIEGKELKASVTPQGIRVQFKENGEEKAA